MEWWQIALILLASIIAGGVVGISLSYLIWRFTRRHETAFLNDLTVVLLGKKPSAAKRQTTAAVAGQLKPATPDLAMEVRDNRIVRLPEKPSSKERETVAVVEPRLKPLVSNLVAEIENNRRIANEPWTGKLLPFETRVLDANGGGDHPLPANIQEDLTEARSDMSVANSIVWLSTELGYRSQTLDEKYAKLRTNIAARLNRIVPLLKS